MEATRCYNICMDWVERRFTFEANMKEAWTALRTDIESAAKSFDRRYANPQIAEIVIDVRTPWCITVTYRPIATNIARQIQICMDEKGKRVFSREDGAEKDVLFYGFNEDGKPQLVDEDGTLMTNDKASQVLLEPFLFPGSQSAPHVRFARTAV